jgi:hypothetical protein
MRTYFLHNQGSTTGPFTLEQILSMWRAGGITADSLAAVVGTDKWFPVTQMVSKAQPSFWRVFLRKFLITLACVFVGIIAICIIGTRTGEQQARKAPDESARFYQAQEHIKANLKSPATARFSPLSDPESAYEHVGKNVWAARGYVDSQNAFGAMLRAKWMVIWDEGTKDILFEKLGDRKTGDFDKAMAAGKQ